MGARPTRTRVGETEGAADAVLERHSSILRARWALDERRQWRLPAGPGEVPIFVGPPASQTTLTLAGAAASTAWLQGRRTARLHAMDRAASTRATLVTQTAAPHVLIRRTTTATAMAAKRSAAAGRIASAALANAQELRTSVAVPVTPMMSTLVVRVAKNVGSARTAFQGSAPVRREMAARWGRRVIQPRTRAQRRATAWRSSATVGAATTGPVFRG
jgi:hypothetical protein